MIGGGPMLPSPSQAGPRRPAANPSTSHCALAYELESGRVTTSGDLPHAGMVPELWTQIGVARALLSNADLPVSAPPKHSRLCMTIQQIEQLSATRSQREGGQKLGSADAAPWTYHPEVAGLAGAQQVTRKLLCTHALLGPGAPAWLLTAARTPSHELFVVHSETADEGALLHAVGVSPQEVSASSSNALLITKLALACASLDRGAIASTSQRCEVEDLISALEASGSDAVDLALLDGTWELIYTSVEPFRSSPFFAAFKEGLLSGNGPLASAIFAFTDSVPGAAVGVARQVIDQAASTLISEVDLAVVPLPGIPGATGVVVTSCGLRATATGAAGVAVMDVTVLNTRVDRSNVAPSFLNQIAVPVQSIFEALRGPGAATTQATVTYLDAGLRITRLSPGSELFVYRRARARWAGED
ncbi:hypothetical protein FOA52_008635 [Chlamydomonas sp. UWO 241]|nr:hypothetical protein FOA52_008635 [Chlamydomonas sp. UWO 241]